MNKNLSLIKIDGVGFNIGGKWLFKNISLSIKKSDKLVLVGRNGTGKSSLLKILYGTLEPHEGSRWVSPKIKISFLTQEPLLKEGMTIQSYLMHEIENSTINKNIQLSFKAESIMNQLNLDPFKLTNNISGGEKRRVSIAKVLLEEPNVLLLDEPTNHLDLQTIEWLEKFLEKLKSALIIVSHDRSFLTSLGNGILWINNNKIYKRNGSFNVFEDWSEKISFDEQKQLHKLDKKIAEEIKWSNHGISARRKRNQGRLKNLLKLKSKHNFKPNDLKNNLSFSIKNLQHSSKFVLEAKNIKISYKGKFNKPSKKIVLVHNFNLIIMKGERIGIIGRNGIGKTSLLNVLLKYNKPESGTIKTGYGFLSAYFDQNREIIDEESTPLKTICPGGGEFVKINGKTIHSNKYLKDFFFTEDKLRQKIKILSGGEKNRLLLSLIFTKDHNFLVLDEPTNDLDVESIDLLQEIISDYNGTVIIVSHDRNFLDRTVSKLISFEDNGKITVNLGGYSEYKQKLKASIEKKLTINNNKKLNLAKSNNKTTNKFSFKDKWLYENLPKDIDKLKIQIKNLEEKLFDETMFSNLTEYKKLSSLLEKDKLKLNEMEEKWLELAIFNEEINKRK